MLRKYTREPCGVRRDWMCILKRSGKKTASASTFTIQSCRAQRPSFLTFSQAPMKESMLLMEEPSPPAFSPVPSKKAWSSHFMMLLPVFLMLLANSASELQNAAVAGLSHLTTQKQNKDVPCVRTPSGAFGTSRVPMCPRSVPSQPPGAEPVSQLPKYSSFFQQEYHLNSVNFQFGTGTLAQHLVSMQFSPAHEHSRIGGTYGMVL
mmetsp:Transcript_91521/g.179249  ORF Transcript_91521/g.179249 Transcript_91521/m.179249 type:complete len:206 (-) Transcript_91521:477-1094(-)